jgi:hypothetical protein
MSCRVSQELISNAEIGDVEGRERRPIAIISSSSFHCKTWRSTFVRTLKFEPSGDDENLAERVGFSFTDRLVGKQGC